MNDGEKYRGFWSRSADGTLAGAAGALEADAVPSFP